MQKSPRARATVGRRLGIAEAKANLSQVVRRAAGGATAGRAFLDRLEALKSRWGGGIDDFAPAELRCAAARPFVGRVRRRR
jgi:hypothetical protein